MNPFNKLNRRNFLQLAALGTAPVMVPSVLASPAFDSFRISLVSPQTVPARGTTLSELSAAMKSGKATATSLAKKYLGASRTLTEAARPSIRSSR